MVDSGWRTQDDGTLGAFGTRCTLSTLGTLSTGRTDYRKNRLYCAIEEGAVKNNWPAGTEIVYYWDNYRVEN